MIELHDAEDQLKEMLGDNKTDVLDVWNTFKSFARLDVECAESSLLFECGVYNFTGKELFHFGFVRQFVVEEDGESSHMEQLHCLLLYEPVEELQFLKKTLWSYDTEDNYEIFFNKVEELKEFLIPVQNYLPLKVKIYQEKV
ncbi:hypothetical protein HQN90_15780 [Paenibacillus alba]|uniref:hypothetical protein n=1 Tax=Paenibacillus alba TaxID=1197127 RepID=UPI0015673EBC|nr:hypothetical protein [Paenibacillus alba]NQX67582.1 hypothetical protein [Paenibacillus alba]